MSIQRLDHVNLRTTQLEVMATWYEQVLGLVNGPRPAFPFPGAWMWAGDVAVVHLIGVEDAAGVGSEHPLKLEHFAFRAHDLAVFEQRLSDQSVDYRKSELPELGLVAFNIWDPDGNHIHVDFEEA
ncbi:MAG: glyoxalase [Pseudomonadota bacterium]